MKQNKQTNLLKPYYELYISCWIFISNYEFSEYEIEFSHLKYIIFIFLNLRLKCSQIDLYKDYYIVFNLRLQLISDRCVIKH